MHGLVPTILANNGYVKSEEDTSTARVFQWATEFIEDNVAGQPFYLMIDCFDPHEPWEAPENYYRMYGKADYDGPKTLHCGYGPLELTGHTEEEIEYVKSHYCGLVSLVDTWVGRFMDKLSSLGLSENTAIFFVSDHGTNFCENPRRVIGKPEDSMYPSVMKIPLFVSLPGAAGWGETCDEIVYNLDVTATVYDLVGISSFSGVDGASLRPLVNGQNTWSRREYATCRYSNSVCYIDDNHWIMTNIDREPLEVFDLGTDPDCQCNIADRVDKAVFDRAWKRIVDDADGELPDYRDAGCPQSLTDGWRREDNEEDAHQQIYQNTDAIGRVRQRR